MKIFLLLFCLTLASCSEKKPEVKVVEKKDTVKKDFVKNEEVKKDTTQVEKEVLSKTLKTKSGKTFNITEKKKSASVSDYEIYGSGFGTFKETFKIENKDPMINSFTADLNDDGFDELYLITQTVGSGSYGNIIGVASINDNSYSLINVDELKDKQLSQSGTFTGYMGRDSIYVTEESIAREFPVYQQTDAMNNPTGGKRIIVYALKFVNGRYDLTVVNSFYMKKGK